MRADFRAILVGYTLRLINKDTNNGFVLGAGNFRVHQLEAMVESDSFRQLLDACRNRIVPHCHLRTLSPPKEKVGANPPDETPCLRASGELYGKGLCEATGGRNDFRHKKAQEARKPVEVLRVFSSLSAFCAFLWLNHPSLNLIFTASATAFPSAFLPARAAWTAFMTRPMSFIEVAPVSAMAA